MKIRLLALSVALILVLPLTSAGEEVSPAMRRHVEAFVAMLGGTDGFEAFVDRHMSREFIRKRGRERGTLIFRVLARRYGGRPARLQSLSATPQGAIFKASNVDGEWAEYELMLEPGDPEGRIGGFNARILPTPLTDDLAGLTGKQIVTELDRFVRAEAEQDRFSGSVILARQGEVLYENALGLADRENQIPNRLETRFRVASVTKLFTALAVGQLVERGLLSYGDTLGKHLPEFPDARLRDSVTVSQLLTHTSGLDPATLIGPHEPEHGAESLEQRAIGYAARPRVGQGGSRYAYSNAGAVFLALILEARYGKPYVDVIRERILEPAGMTGAGFTPLGGGTPRASGYTQGRDGAWRLADLPPPDDPSGGLWASARDLLAFSRALADGRLVRPETLEEMTRARVEIGEDESCGYGWMERRVNSVRCVGHAGSLPGWSADFTLIPDRGYTLIVLCNRDGQARAVADRVRQMLSLGKVTGEPGAPEAAD